MNYPENGDSNAITRQYFDSILVEMRQLDSGLADTSVELFGKTFSTPVMMAALSHLNSCHDDGMAEMARGAKMAGAVNWAGMGDESELEHICKSNPDTVKIVKPYADEDLIISRLRCAEECGCLAVGMDIDHAFGGNGQYDNVLGFEMRAISTDDLKRYIAATSLPFVVKGVLSVRDAEKCANAGAKAIVVSHHHGIMKYAVPPLYVLPEIRSAVGKDMQIFVDCGVENGYDVFKALALGADAVCIGRAIMPSLHDKGAQGVYEKVLQTTGELKAMMSRTGSKNLREIDPSVLRRL